MKEAAIQAIKNSGMAVDAAVPACSTALSDIHVKLEEELPAQPSSHKEAALIFGTGFRRPTTLLSPALTEKGDVDDLRP